MSLGETGSDSGIRFDYWYALSISNTRTGPRMGTVFMHNPSSNPLV